MPTTITIYPAKVQVQSTGTEGSANLQTLAAAVTANSANNALYQYNLPEANSLHPATDLQTLFPGLKLQNTPDVDTLHPAELIKQYRPEAERDDHLIILSPGEEHHILNTLAESELLNTFSQLTILAHDEPMYEQAQPASATLSWLEAQGFELSARDDEDADWPRWHLARNPLQSTLDAVKKEKTALAETLQQRDQQVEKLQAECHEQKQRTEQLQSENQSLKEARQKLKGEAENSSKRIGELEGQLEHKNTEVGRLTENNSALTEKLQEAEKALDREKTAHGEATKVSEDYKKQLQQRNQKVEKLQAELHEQKQRTEQLQSENQSLKEARQKLTAETENSSKRIGELEAQLEHRSTELAGLNQQLEQARGDQQQLQEQLANQSNTQSALKTLQERMDYLFGQNTLQLEQAANALGQHVSQTAQHTATEIESGLALQQQLGPDAPALSPAESGLPKSAALHLARQLKSQPYDLIIELGSGATTHFMAHTLRNAYKTGQQTADQKKLSHVVEASDEDLPKRILSLEHSRSRYNQLNEQLKNSGLSGYVHLQFTPLVPFPYQGKEPLFYDCANRLQHLSQILDGRQANILVMVNQPEDGSGPDPKAALPALLQYLSSHKLEVVFNAQANPDLRGHWLNLMQERGLEHTEAKAFGAEPLQHITVNP